MGRREREEEGDSPRAQEQLQRALHYQPVGAGSTALNQLGRLLGASASAGGVGIFKLKKVIQKSPTVVMLLIKQWFNVVPLGGGCLLELSLTVLITYTNGTYYFPSAYVL